MCHATEGMTTLQGMYLRELWNGEQIHTSIWNQWRLERRKNESHYDYLCDTDTRIEEQI